MGRPEESDKNVCMTVTIEGGGTRGIFAFKYSHTLKDVPGGSSC